MKRRIMALILALALVFGLNTMAFAATAPYTDASKDWYKYDVQWAYDEGLMNGTSETTFSPDLTANRAMVVTTLWRWVGSPKASAANPFIDVLSGKYYTDAVAWAAENGIVNGMGKDAQGNDVFAPSDAMTREQMVTVFHRFAKYKGYDVTVEGNLNEFIDAGKVSSWAKDAMIWAVENKIVEGVGNMKLDPSSTATRAHLAVILHRLNDQVIDPIPFTDLVANWYKAAVRWTYKKGLMNGTSETTFSPNLMATRAMVVTTMWRWEGSPEAIGSNSFADVPDGKYYTEAVTWAAENGIVEGMGKDAQGNRIFAPLEAMTREQMVTLFYRFAKYRGYDVRVKGDLTKFVDANKVSSWAEKAMAWSVGCKVIEGVGNQTLDPKGTGTRAHMAVILYRLNELVIAPNEEGGYYPIPSSTYTVTFDSKGGSAVASQIVEAGEKATKPADPTKECAIFDGWYTDAACTVLYDFDTPVNSSFTLYAKWIDAKDYIGIAVEDAMSEIQSTYIDQIADKLNNKYMDASSSVVVDEFKYSDVETADDTRAQELTASAKLAAELKKDAIVNAAYYAGAAVIGTVTNRAEVKRYVNPVIDEVNAWLGVEAITDVDRDIIIDRVYEALKARANTIWDSFKGADGYYTGNVTITAGAGATAASTTVIVDDAVSYKEGKTAAAKKLSIALAKELWGNIAKVTDWTDEVTLKGTITFTFTDGDAYKAHTVFYPHVYPFNITMDLDGNGIVEYKFVANTTNVKLNISQGAQDRYEAAVDAVVEKALRNQTVLNFMQEKMSGLIDSYVNADKIASMIPDDITLNANALENILRGIIGSWFKDNSGFSVMDLNATINPDEVLNSYFYKKCWLGENVQRDDSTLEGLAAAYDKQIVDLIKPEVEKEVKSELQDKLAEKKADVLAKVSGLNASNLGVTLPEWAAGYQAELEQKMNAKCQEIFDEELDKLESKLASEYEITHNFVVTGVTKDNWEAKLNAAVLDDALVAKLVDKAMEDAPTSKEIAKKIGDEVESTKYFEYLEKATNVQRFDSMAEVKLGNAAAVLGNETAQNFLVGKLGDKSESYLLKVADQLKKLPENASIKIEGVETINADLVAKVQAADSVEAICEAVADILALPGMAEQSVSEFYNGKKVTVNYDGKSFSFVLWVEAE